MSILTFLLLKLIEINRKLESECIGKLNPHLKDYKNQSLFPGPNLKEKKPQAFSLIRPVVYKLDE